MAGIFNRNIKNKFIEEMKHDLVGDGLIVTSINVTTAGTGYTANASVSFQNGTAVAASIASSAGKISSASVIYGGTFYTAAPNITFSAPAAKRFNANSAVTGGVSTGLSTDANSTISVEFVSSEFDTPVFEVGDAIRYTFSTGNTAISPLTNGTTYYVQHANTTKIALATTPTGSRITLTKGFTEAGHFLRGITATGTTTVNSSGSNYYITFGKFFEWDDDSNPPATNTSIKESFYDVYSNILFGKKVFETDIGYIAKRITWTTGTVYDYYSHLDPNLYQKNFYIVTSLNRVYKCIFNNYGVASTVEPTNTQTSGTFTLADGYVWKYMFTIPGASINKFSTAAYFPVVPNSTVAAQAIKGALHAIVLDNVGKNYISANGSIDQVIDTKNFKVANTGASIINGAYSGSSLYVYSGSGSPALSAISNYVVNTAGKFVTTSSDIRSLDSTSLYRITPRVIISGDGTGASAYSMIDSSTGKLQSINIINSGRNYSYADISILANSEFGSLASAYPIISPPGGHGSDAISELGTDIMGISVETKPTDVFPNWAKYRQIGLLYNPTSSANSALYNEFKFNNMLNFSLFNTTNIFNSGDTIRGLLSKATATVAYMNTSSMYVLNTVGNFRSYESVISNDTGKTCTITVINNPELVPYSGEIFYYKNIEPIDRSGISKEQVKLYFNF
jgi:hypothetical protein